VALELAPGEDDSEGPAHLLPHCGLGQTDPDQLPPTTTLPGPRPHKPTRATSVKPTRINLRQLPLSRDHSLTSRPGLPRSNRLGSTSTNYHSPGTAASQADPGYLGQTDSDQPPPTTTLPGPRPHKPTRATSQTRSHSPTRPPWGRPARRPRIGLTVPPTPGQPMPSPGHWGHPQCPHKDGALSGGPVQLASREFCSFFIACMSDTVTGFNC
jgi:hypothetical protein